MTKLVLPLPPSVNSLYAGYGRRHKSKRYEKWTVEARNALRFQPFTPLDAVPLMAHFRIGRPDRRKRDLSNLLKAAEDFMVDTGVIPDDSWIHKLTAEWDAVEGMHIEISPLSY